MKPPISEAEGVIIAAVAEERAALAGELAHSLIPPDPVPSPPVLPRSVSWVAVEAGDLIITERQGERSTMLVAKHGNAFSQVMAALVHPGFYAETAGNC